MSFRAMLEIVGCYMFPDHMLFLLSFENFDISRGLLFFLCQKCHQNLFFQFTFYIKLTPIVTCDAVFCKNSRGNRLSKGAAMEPGYSQDRFLLKFITFIMPSIHQYLVHSHSCGSRAQTDGSNHGWVGSRVESRPKSALHVPVQVIALERDKKCLPRPLATSEQDSRFKLLENA
jgi:hypothetical protein